MSYIALCKLLVELQHWDMQTHCLPIVNLVTKVVTLTTLNNVLVIVKLAWVAL